VSMRKSAFTTVTTARSTSDAETLLALLRRGGLHPVDLSLSAPLPLAGVERSFPIDVPGEEADAARNLLERVHMPHESSP
jgi:hypothetical protein